MDPKKVLVVGNISVIGHVLHILTEENVDVEIVEYPEDAYWMMQEKRYDIVAVASGETELSFRNMADIVDLDPIRAQPVVLVRSGIACWESKGADKGEVFDAVVPNFSVGEFRRAYDALLRGPVG